MRRVMVWAVVIFVILSGVLSGNQSAAQDHGSRVLMVMYDREMESGGGKFNYTLYLQDPLTGETWPLSVGQFWQYLQHENIYYDPQLESYGWSTGGATLMGDYAEIISNDYTQDVVYTSLLRMSPDWNWAVYWMRYHVYAVNIDEGIPRDLFAAHGLMQYDDFLGVAFAPDGETIYIQAQNTSGNAGLYRLRLDGSDLPGIMPLAETDLLPLMWLDGTDSFVAARYEMTEGYMAVGVVNADGSTQSLFTNMANEKYPREVRFEGWIPATQTLVWSTDSFLGSDQLLFGVDISNGGSWGIMGWWPLGMTADRQWLILEDGDQLARMRTNGSEFETVTEIAGGAWHHAIYSPNGNSVAKWSYDGTDYVLYLADMVSGHVTELNLGQYYVNFGLNNWSPDGKWLIYYLGTYESSRTVITDVSGQIVYEEINDVNTLSFLAWVTLDEWP